MFYYTALAAATHLVLSAEFPGYGHIADKVLSSIEYPTYAYLIFRFVRPTLGPLLPGPLARRIIQPPRTYLAYCRVGISFLLSAAFRLVLRLGSRIVHKIGIGAPICHGYGYLAGRLKSISRFPTFVRPTVENVSHLIAMRFMNLGRRAAVAWQHIIGCIDYLFVEACSQLGLALWPYALSHAASCLFPSCGVAVPVYDPSIVSKYPLTILTGMVTLVILRNVLLEALWLGGLAFSSATYLVAVAIVRLICLAMPKFVVWVALGLLVASFAISPHELNLCVKYTVLACLIHGDTLARLFIRPRMSLRNVLNCGFRVVRHCFTRLCLPPLRWLVRIGAAVSRLVLRQAVRLLSIEVVVPVARPSVSKFVGWASRACIVGGVVVATASAMLVAAIALTAIVCVNLLVRPKVHWEATRKSLEFLNSDIETHHPPTTSPEASLTDSHSPVGSAELKPSQGVRRLALLVNAYLGDSAPVESIEELEAHLGNSSSIHAPLVAEATYPPTPFFSVPTTPVLAPSIFRTPVPPPIPSAAPEGTEEDEGDEDQDILSLTTRFSNFRLALESNQGPREVQREIRRSPITFEAYRPLTDPGPVTPPRKGWTYREWERGAIAAFCLGLVAPVNEGLQERNLARVNAGYVVDMLMRK